MTFVLKCYDLCEQSNAEFRVQTLPAGVAKLIELSQAVPEKEDAARGVDAGAIAHAAAESKKIAAAVHEARVRAVKAAL